MNDFPEHPDAALERQLDAEMLAREAQQPPIRPAVVLGDLTYAELKACLHKVREYAEDVYRGSPELGAYPARGLASTIVRCIERHMARSPQPALPRGADPMSTATLAFRHFGLPATLSAEQRQAWEDHQAGRAVPLRLLPKSGDNCRADSMNGLCGHPLLIDGSCPGRSDHRDVVEAQSDEGPPRLRVTRADLGEAYHNAPHRIGTLGGQGGSISVSQHTGAEYVAALVAHAAGFALEVEQADGGVVLYPLPQEAETEGTQA
jgi:hypothetical protein